MPEIQITELAIIVVAICTTIVLLTLIFRTKEGLKLQLDKSGVKIEMADNEPDVTPDIKEEKDETSA
jgi:hypothetical protein